MNYEQFKYYNKMSVNSGLVRKASIEDRQFKEDTCRIYGRTMKIGNVVQDVLSQKYCLTNPSLLTQWKGFREDNQNVKKDLQKEEKGNYVKQNDYEKYQQACAVEEMNVPFEVVFKPKNKGQDETYYYRNKKEAEAHLEMFKDDDSGIYRTISLINSQKNEVYRILYFEGHSDICTLDLSKDDIVKLKAVFCASSEELKHFYSVKNINDNSCSCEICCLNSKLSLGSIERVGLEMICLTGKKMSDLVNRK